MENSNLIILVGVIVLAWVALDIIRMTLQNRANMTIVAALTEAVKSAQGNTKALDLIEPMASKVIPVSVLDFFRKGGEAAKAILPDDWDALIDHVEQLVTAATDGKPNDAATLALAQNTRLALSKIMPLDAKGSKG